MLIDKCRKEIILVDNKWYLDGVKDIILDYGAANAASTQPGNNYITKLFF